MKSSCQYLFSLLGSTSVKAVRGTLMKLSQDVDEFTKREIIRPFPFDQHIIGFDENSKKHFNLKTRLSTKYDTLFLKETSNNLHSSIE